LEQAAEMQVGDKQPRTFTVNDNVIVRDLRPTATDRWRKGVVTKILGPLNYEVSVDGRSRQAHVDHLHCTIPLEVVSPSLAEPDRFFSRPHTKEKKRSGSARLGQPHS